MTIRPAVLADVDALVALGLEMVASTEYAQHIAPNEARLRWLAAWLIEGTTGTILVAEHADGALDGMVGMFTFEHLMSGALTASEVFWFVRPAARGSLGIRLLTRAFAWATAAGATAIQLVAPNSHVEQLYERLGFTKVETAYQRSTAR